MIYLLFGGAISFASTDASYSISTAGGVFGSVMRTDVLGLYVNPASAATEEAQLKLDTALIYFDLFYKTDAPEQDILLERYDGELPEGWAPIRDAYSQKGFAPLLSLGTTIPIYKDWSIGFESFIPYATGARFDDDISFRFHTTGGQFFWFEQNLALAKKIHLEKSELKLGVALKGGYLALASFASIDTGTMIYELTGDDSVILDLSKMNKIIDFNNSL